MKKRRWVHVLFVLLLGLGLRNIHVAIFDSSNTIRFPDRRTDTLMDLPRVFAPTQNEKTIIAYAVTVTSYDPDDKVSRLLDRAAVLHQSIKLAMKQSARYDYHLYAFVHPDAQDFAPYLEQLGYRVQMHDTPFNITEVNVANPSFVRAQRVGCCGEKEYLKLYSWLLLDYPVVLHMDLDTLVLRPMDDLFDLMTDPSYDRRRFQNSSMWTDMEQFEGPVDFLFTRDYNMVDPPRKRPHQIGVQGGFLVVRPNASDFQKYVDTIVSGEHWFDRTGWGGHKLGYGGYYGASTIQGLASYYYGHLEQNRSIELNRCYYNTMVDEPTSFNEELNQTFCTTLETSCQDCRETLLEDIYTAHFTSDCGKPEWCYLKHELELCLKLFYKWHDVRWSLEQEWVKKYPGYTPNTANVTSNLTEKDRARASRRGHCGAAKPAKYLALQLPSNVTEPLL